MRINVVQGRSEPTLLDDRSLLLKVKHGVNVNDINTERYRSITCLFDSRILYTHTYTVTLVLWLILKEKKNSVVKRLSFPQPVNE